MKIHQLPLGARFEYEGEEYVKTGPMFATSKEGGQRLIPKFALLRVLADDGLPGKGSLSPAAKAGCLDAFGDFYAACRELVPEDRHSELSDARERFMKALERLP